ncbi:MAG: ferric reductase-like transmembrane domain-containing protein [Prevotellaceae bacterium]|jgi:DMSO/TMAO reductase YedYZ heme-binding membrane subunit|nr:ferric reductase-like transmembrane domain-containing protein [Prevotellaceae bacterium]
MIKLLIDFIQFLNTLAPLFMSLAVLTLLAVLLSKSIKRHATVYYIVLAIPFAMVAIPFIGRWFGIEIFNFNRIPFLGGILRDYIHMGTLGFPLLIIIMYIGALNPKNSIVKKLLGIRKELSIMSGFPILTHSLIRVTNNFPNALKFFTDNEGYMENARMTNALGAGITSFSFVLGVLMLALFILLWITSFDSVHKRMGNVKWKKLQRWSYVLYAMLFIHAMGIQTGAMLNQRERETPKPTVEISAATTTETHNRNNRENQELQRHGDRNERSDKNAVQPIDSANQVNNQNRADRDSRTEAVRPTAERGGHQQSQGFADITVSPQAKRYMHIASLLLIFGSYLYFRLRKARLKNR